MAQSHSGTAPDTWLKQMLLECAEKHGVSSSYFARPTPQRLALLLVHPDHSAEMERRYLLSQVMTGQVAFQGRLCPLGVPGQTSNPGLWLGLVEASAMTAPAR